MLDKTSNSIKKTTRQKDQKERQSRMGKIKDKTATTAATYVG